MHCENQNCRKTGLTKAEVEKDTKRNMILCTGCFALSNPDLIAQLPEVVSEMREPPVDGVGYHLSLDSVRGLSAQVSYGDVALELNVPHRTLRGLLR